jgi:hypothetical protein
VDPVPGPLLLTIWYRRESNPRPLGLQPGTPVILSVIDCRHNSLQHLASNLMVRGSRNFVLLCHGQFPINSRTQSRKSIAFNSSLMLRGEVGDHTKNYVHINFFSFPFQDFLPVNYFSCFFNCPFIAPH